MLEVGKSGVGKLGVSSLSLSARAEGSAWRGVLSAWRGEELEFQVRVQEWNLQLLNH